MPDRSAQLIEALAGFLPASCLPGATAPAPQPDGSLVAASVDSLWEGQHFPIGTAPADVGHKALAVNLSDMAAMGARPLAISLILRLPQTDSGWIEGFAEGFGRLAEHFDVRLDQLQVVPGRLGVTVQIIGLLPDDKALTRAGARAGDAICVSGTLGDAAAALQQLQSGHSPVAELLARLNRPQPRVALGLALGAVAHSAIDLSDGLCRDLPRILEASGVGADIVLTDLPISPALRSSTAPERGIAWAWQGGDDYELCFSLPEEKLAQLAIIADGLDLKITQIGRITAAPGLSLHGPGSDKLRELTGFDHFA